MGDLARLRTLRYRKIRVDDLDDVRALHEAWFPVRYSQAFYDAAVRERMVGTHEPLFTLVAEVDEDEFDAAVDAAASDAAQLDGSEDAIPPESVRNDDASSVNSGFAQRRVIIGLVTAQLTTTAACGDSESLFQPACEFDEEACDRVVYVLTLGTHDAFRRRGLAKALLTECIDWASHTVGCGVVYLHVITYNTAAILFYQQHGFVRLCHIDAYYRIDEKKYGCFVYAHYLPGAKYPAGWKPPEQSWLARLLSHVFPQTLRTCLRRYPSPKPMAHLDDEFGGEHADEVDYGPTNEDAPTDDLPPPDFPWVDDAGNMHRRAPDDGGMHRNGPTNGDAPQSEDSPRSEDDAR
ncbi:acyl-CoA N-acyltransferase [Pelagophyceae sp. CCMP2097]|nr:acyl-CoA N-acyltransferase [Pelagophyceae sp. CCMP2097]|mmetsp:Transcript_9065/g.29940  ORF Transcript_9065/g.29940 Transcript_9065/m.29940 type:complete len:350 (-) Transcript_9065:89-1138(-)